MYKFLNYMRKPFPTFILCIFLAGFTHFGIKYSIAADKNRYKKIPTNDPFVIQPPTCAFSGSTIVGWYNPNNNKVTTYWNIACSNGYSEGCNFIIEVQFYWLNSANQWLYIYPDVCVASSLECDTTELGIPVTENVPALMGPGTYMATFTLCQGICSDITKVCGSQSIICQVPAPGTISLGEDK